MATYYLDPIGGNDANDGTTFANRWQSLTSGATAARIAAGDTIRVIQSPDPTSVGNATWTDGSRTVTLASAATATINDATTGWTASANAGGGTSSSRKIGANSSSLSVTSFFTTGKSHYTSVAQADYSAYQQISFWIMQTAGTLASGDGEISIKLCSDATGTTAVNTFNIPRIRALNQWQCYTLDNAAALGSSIGSIAFYINTDRGAQTFLVNNIIAVKAKSSADSLSLTSLISKNSGNEGWYAIDSISGTTVTLQTAGPNYNLSLSGTPAGYAGSTETVGTYKREPIQLPSSLVASATNSSFFGKIVEGGSLGSPLTISGGWDSTNMSSQVGQTYISGVNGFGYGVFLYNDGVTYPTDVNIERVNISGFRIGMLAMGDVRRLSVTAQDISCNHWANLAIESDGYGLKGPSNCTFNVNNVNCAGQALGTAVEFWHSAKNITLNIVNMNSNWGYGIQSYTTGTSTSNPWSISGLKANVTNCRRNGSAGALLTSLTNADITFGTLSNNWRGVWSDVTYSNTRNPGLSNSKITITNSASNHTNYFAYLFGSRNIDIYLNGATVASNGSSGCVFLASNGIRVHGGTFGTNTFYDVEVDAGSDVTLSDATLGSTTPYALWEDGSSCLRLHNYQTTQGDHRTLYNHGSIMTNTSVRHTASGYSWGISPTNTDFVTENFPMVLPLGPVAVASGTLVTATVWVNRTNTGITTKLVAKGGQIAGVTSDVVATAAGSADTWEQLTVTFTPSQAGVIEFEVQAYGGTTYTVYVDDFDVTQA